MIVNLFLSVAKVNWWPERCSSSISSPPPQKHADHLYTVFWLTATSFYLDKHFIGFCSHLAQFKTKFHVHSLFDFTAVRVLRQRCKTYVHCTLFTDMVNGASTGVGRTRHMHWLCLLHTTYNKAHSFTVSVISIVKWSTVHYWWLKVDSQYYVSHYLWIVHSRHV